MERALSAYLDSSVGSRTASLATRTWDACRGSILLLHRSGEVNISHNSVESSSKACRGRIVGGRKIVRGQRLFAQGTREVRVFRCVTCGGRDDRPVL